MKHLIVSLTIGACLLLSSAGVVFAVDAHKASTSSGTGAPGRNGTNGSMVASCGSGGTGGVGTQAGPSGQAHNNSATSPFNSVKVYAGSGAGNSDSAGGVPASQYDNACFQNQVP